MTYTLLVSHEPADFHWLSANKDRLTQAEIIPNTSPWPCRFLCLSKKLGATNKITEPCLSLCCSNFKHNKGSGSCHHVFLLMRGLVLGMMRLKEVLNYNMHASLMTTKVPNSVRRRIGGCMASATIPMAMDTTTQASY